MKAQSSLETLVSLGFMLTILIALIWIVVAEQSDISSNNQYLLAQEFCGSLNLAASQAKQGLNTTVYLSPYFLYDVWAYPANRIIDANLTTCRIVANITNSSFTTQPFQIWNGTIALYPSGGQVVLS